MHILDLGILLFTQDGPFSTSTFVVSGHLQLVGCVAAGVRTETCLGGSFHAALLDGILFTA